MISFQKPGYDGWRYSVSYRTRKDGYGDWTVQRWNGTDWEFVVRCGSYAGARELATLDQTRRIPLSLREQIIREAEESHKQYPQYAGHWDDWYLVRITSPKPIKTRLGVAFTPGEYTIARDPRDPDGEIDNWYTAYSRSNKCDTALSAKKFEKVAA